MGAMLATDEMSRGFEAGSHATTFGRGALASAVARKVIEIMLRDRLWERAEINGGELIARLEDLRGEMPDKIRDVRGQGLMIGGGAGFRRARGLERTAEQGLYLQPGAITLPCAFCRRFRPLPGRIWTALLKH